MNPVLYFTIFTAIAFLLLTIEVFIPGGVVGSIGAVCLLVACGFALVGFGTGVGLLISMCLILGTLIAFLFWLSKMGDTRVGKRFSLQTTLTNGNSSNPYQLTLGDQGVAETDLRPGGFARFGDLKIDVTTEQTYIEKGTTLTVTKVLGNRIVVSAAQHTTT
ncbi:NfeD family protein [Kiritimatiellota bacterium B12222]|nr:NfeD family protein [Kiritimatiellota bacterium B12222]